MQDPDKLDCAQAAEMLDAFHDMELEMADAERVEAHLANCSACRRELESIEKIVASLKALPELPTKDFADAIEARILSQAAATPQAETVAAPIAEPVAPLEPARPVLTLVSNKDNVRSLSTAPRRSRFLAVAAAAVLLGGVLVISALGPKAPTEIARAPVAPVSDIQTASSTVSISPLSEDVVALYDEEGGNNVSDVGISTNEDGLYAIKM